MDELNQLCPHLTELLFNGFLLLRIVIRYFLLDVINFLINYFDDLFFDFFCFFSDLRYLVVLTLLH